MKKFVLFLSASVLSVSTLFYACTSQDKVEPRLNNINSDINSSGGRVSYLMLDVPQNFASPTEYEGDFYEEEVALTGNLSQYYEGLSNVSVNIYVKLDTNM